MTENDDSRLGNSQTEDRLGDERAPETDERPEAKDVGRRSLEGSAAHASLQISAEETIISSSVETMLSAGGIEAGRPEHESPKCSVRSDDDFVEDEARFRRQSTDVTTEEEMSLSEIDPPPSRGELFRDALFCCLDVALLRVVGFVVLFFVILDGSFYFFLMIGAHGMCTPRSDCEPRNWWLNWSIQVLNALFTYTALVSFPPRLSNAVHLVTPRRSSEVGLDYYGRPTHRMWFHIPPKRRGWIVAFLLGNCLAQFANQICRIIFYTHELSNTMPGSLLVNLFFFLAMILAAIGAIWQLFEEHKLHVSEPDKFPPGPVGILREQKNKYCRGKKRSDEDDNDIDNDDIETPGKRRKSIQDLTKSVGRTVASPWKKLARWFKNERPSMQLWGF